MRDIKFRVWDKSIPTDESDMQLENPSGMMINWDYVLQSNYLIKALNGQYPIMQYTGVKDKNNVSVYEGDIVRMTISKPETGSPFGGNEDSFDGYAQGEVIIHKRYGVCLKDAFIYDTDNDCVAIQKTKIFKTLASYRSEVIGNVFNNPELCSA